MPIYQLGSLGMKSSNVPTWHTIKRLVLPFLTSVNRTTWVRILQSYAFSKSSTLQEIFYSAYPVFDQWRENATKTYLSRKVATFIRLVFCWSVDASSFIRCHNITSMYALINRGRRSNLLILPSCRIAVIHHPQSDVVLQDFWKTWSSLVVAILFISLASPTTKSSKRFLEGVESQRWSIHSTNWRSYTHDRAVSNWGVSNPKI